MNHSKDKLIKKLQHKNELLTKELQHERKLLTEIRKLWQARENQDKLSDIENSTLMHEIEILDKIINNPDNLNDITSLSCEEFDYLLKQFPKQIEKHPEAPLFFEGNYIDPGNRCKLHHRHVLLLALAYKKSNMTQGQLAAFSGVDQSTISRYIEFADIILREILPIPSKINDMIKKITIVDKVKEIIPNRVMLIDGTHVLIRRPGDPLAQKDMYSGKKKRHTINTTIITNLNGLIIFISKSVKGYTHDFTMFQNDQPDFGIWSKMMRDKFTRNCDRIIVYVDLGYLGIKKSTRELF